MKMSSGGEWFAAGGRFLKSGNWILWATDLTSTPQQKLLVRVINVHFAILTLMNAEILSINNVPGKNADPPLVHHHLPSGGRKN